jgi:hypothetical protein
LGRIAAVDYREVLLSYLFPGAQTSASALPLLIDQFERLLALSLCNRHHILLRMDAGFGTDTNLTWLLPRGYQVVVKGFSASRAAAHARRITTWTEIRPNDTWIAWSPKPLVFTRPTRTAVVRWRTPKRERHALYITTLTDLTLHELAELYDDRGQVEVEIQSDKMGLLIARRRKSQFAAQEMLILLNDWVHNFLAWFHAAILLDSPFAAFGPKRIVRDLFTIPGEATIANDSLLELRLSESHPYAAAMVTCLNCLWQTPHL